MPPHPPPVTMSADLYDYLDLCSEAFGGLGPGAFFTIDGAGAIRPQCAIGCLMFATPPVTIGGGNTLMWNTAETAAAFPDEWQELVRGTEWGILHDKAIYTINRAQGRCPNARVPWVDIAAELGILRGKA